MLCTLNIKIYILNKKSLAMLCTLTSIHKKKSRTNGSTLFIINVVALSRWLRSFCFDELFAGAADVIRACFFN